MIRPPQRVQRAGAVTVLVAFIVAGIVNAAIGGFFVMIGFGILHSIFAQVPALGFGPSVLLSIAVTLILGTVRR